MQKWHIGIVVGALVLAQTLGFAEGSQPSKGPDAASKAPKTGSKPGTNHTSAAIQGSARTSTNEPIVGATVRLRDARTGHLGASVTTDKAGAYVFQSLDPGNYIVELLGPDQTVITTSQLISINAGETVAAAVQLPFKIPPFGGVLGHSAASAAVIAATAAASGLLATAVSGNSVSPRQ